MRLLLDTHVLLWLMAAPERFSRASESLIVASDNELFLSAASSWEIAIKHGLGRLPLPEAPGDYIPRLMARVGITPLPVLHQHALHVATLPLHHRDPFDRLLVAQAQVEDLPIMTADRAFALYDVEVLPA